MSFTNKRTRLFRYGAIFLLIFAKENVNGDDEDDDDDDDRVCYSKPLRQMSTIDKTNKHV